MSGTLNKVMLIGHLGDDVKTTYFEGGGCIGRFPLATNETYTNRQTGERVTNTEWHNVVVRNKAAEVCERYLSKGDKVYVEGRLKTRQWQGEDGNTRYTTEIQATDFTFLTNKNDSQSGDVGSQKNDQRTHQVGSQESSNPQSEREGDTSLSNKNNSQSDNVGSQQNDQRTQQVESQESSNPQPEENDDLPF